MRSQSFRILFLFLMH